MANLATGFPNGPFVDPSGEVTDVWRRYLLTLDARTGGRLGADAGDTAARLTSETAARSAGDVNLSSGLAAERGARETADAAERAARIAGDNALAIAHSDPFEATARAAADVALGLRIDALGETGVYAPLCTGDVPPQLIGTSDGQAIMVRIS